MGHIFTKLHQFLISSSQDFVHTDTDAHTDTRTYATKTIPAHSIAGTQVIMMISNDIFSFNLLL